MFDERPRHARLLTSKPFVFMLCLAWVAVLRFDDVRKVSSLYFTIVSIVGWTCMVLTGGFLGFGFWYGFTPQHRAGICSGCGYSLTGNTSGVCPECGTSVSSAPDQKL
jgi:hypothetical protein